MIITLYQKYLSNIVKLLLPHANPGCRFYPPCSHYARDAYKKYGAWRGTYKTIGRILRCNPYNKGGFDYP